MVIDRAASAVRVVRERRGIGLAEVKVRIAADGVEFGAEHYGGSGAVLQESNNSGAAHLFGDIVAELAEMVSEFGGSLSFVRGQLRILM